MELPDVDIFPLQLLNQPFRPNFEECAFIFENDCDVYSENTLMLEALSKRLKHVRDDSEVLKVVTITPKERDITNDFLYRVKIRKLWQVENKRHCNFLNDHIGNEFNIILFIQLQTVKLSDDQVLAELKEEEMMEYFLVFFDESGEIQKKLSDYYFTNFRLELSKNVRPIEEQRNVDIAKFQLGKEIILQKMQDEKPTQINRLCTPHISCHFFPDSAMAVVYGTHKYASEFGVRLKELVEKRIEWRFVKMLENANPFWHRYVQFLSNKWGQIKIIDSAIIKKQNAFARTSILIYVSGQKDFTEEKLFIQDWAEISKKDLQAYLRQLKDKRTVEQYLKKSSLLFYNREKKAYEGEKKTIENLKFIMETLEPSKRGEEAEEMKEKALAGNMKQVKNVFHCGQMSIAKDNYQLFTKKVVKFKLIEESKYYEIDLANHFRITNRSRGISKIFVVFSELHDILSLQAIIDVDLPLSYYSEIIHKFKADPKKTIMQMEMSQKTGKHQICFMRRSNFNQWKEFIGEINKKCQNSNIIVMKFELLGEVMQNAELFSGLVRIGIPDEDIDRLSLGPYENNAIQVVKAEVGVIHNHSMQRVKTFCLQLLNKEFKFTRIKEGFIDNITLFNLYKLDDEKHEFFEIILQNQSNPYSKRYVYFTFFDKLFKIVKEDIEVKIYETTLKLQFKDDIYVEKFKILKRDAIIKGLEIFFFTDDIKGRHAIKLPLQDDSLKKVKKPSPFLEVQAVTSYSFQKQYDYMKMLYYNFTMNEIKYKMEIDIKESQKDFVEHFESTYAIEFADNQNKAKIAKLQIGAKLEKYKDKDWKKVGVRAKKNICQKIIQMIQEMGKSNK